MLIFMKGQMYVRYFSAVLKKPVQVGTFVKDVVNPANIRKRTRHALYDISTEEQEAVEVKVGYILYFHRECSFQPGNLRLRMLP